MLSLVNKIQIVFEYSVAVFKVMGESLVLYAKDKPKYCSVI